MRIGLLNNLRAGRSAQHTRRLRRCAARYADVLYTETAHAPEVPLALEEFARQDVDVVAVHGGDGTLMRVLTLILDRDAFCGRVPLIAPLRGGRTNMTALDLGARRDPVRGLEALIAAAFHDRMHEITLSRRVLRVEFAPERQRAYGMFFGSSVIHRRIETVHEIFPRGRARGVVGASLVTSVWLARLALLHDARGMLTPDKLQLVLDGRPQPGAAYTLAMATTLGRLFGGIRPFWGKGPGGVRFTALGSPLPGLRGALPGILLGRPGKQVTEQAGYLSRNVDRAFISAQCGFTIDGELVDPGPDRVIELGATEPLRFVRA